MLSQRGIQANLDKCQVVIEMRSPKTFKEIQRLTGRIASLIRFLPWIAEKARPIMNLLKKTKKFKWDQEYEQAFQNLKLTLATLPLLIKLDSLKSLIIYPLVSGKAISTVTIQENKGTIYFVSQILHEAETRYQLIKKVALTLVYVAQRLQ